MSHTCAVCQSPLTVEHGLIHECPQHPIGDKGADRDNRPEKPCLKRVKVGSRYGFCVLPDGHAELSDTDERFADKCVTTFLSEAEAVDFGPEASKRRRW